MLVYRRKPRSRPRPEGPGLGREIRLLGRRETEEAPVQRRDINAADAPALTGQSTQALEATGASRTLYLSGQVGIAADGSVPDDAEAQCALAWWNLQAQLRAAGMVIENLKRSPRSCATRWPCGGAGRP